MKFRTISSFTVSALLTLSLAACGGGGGESTGRRRRRTLSGHRATLDALCQSDHAKLINRNFKHIG